MLMRRLAYRQFLSRLRTESELTAEQADAIRDVLLRPRLFNAVASDLDAEVESKGIEAAAIGDGKLALWLWEHREEILAFIVKVIETFKPIFA